MDYREYGEELLMFDTVHKRDYVSVSKWPLQPVDLQQGARWRAAIHWAPAGHWWGSWRTTPQRDASEPVKSKWTIHVPDDTNYRAHCCTGYSPPHLQFCVVPQRAALNSQVHIIYTCNNLEAQRKGHSEGQTDACSSYSFLLILFVLLVSICLSDIFLYILKKYMNWWQEVKRQKIK